MRKCIGLFLLLLPGVALAQVTTEDYAIYSQYLKIVQDSYKTEKVCFVVNETTAYSLKYFPPEINDWVEELRGYLKNKASMFYAEFTFKDFTKTIISDTLWVSMLADLDKKMRQPFKIENHFSPDLEIVVIDTNIYNKYFSHFKTVRRIDRNWTRFHKKYGTPAVLIEISPIATDGQRAVFYFSTRCNGLCGEGDILFFGKENNEWKFLKSAPLWYN
jgi:hypothetical protein